MSPATRGVDAGDCRPLRGGGHGGPAARDQAPRPAARGAVWCARPRLSERLSRGARVEADARLGAGRVRQDDAAGRVAGGRSAADGRSAAWLSLDQRDNDPALFWTYVIAALQTAAPGVGAGALRAPAVAPAADRGGPRHAAQRPRRRPGRRRAGARRLPRHRRARRAGRDGLPARAPAAAAAPGDRQPRRSGAAAGPAAGAGRAGRDPRRRPALHPRRGRGVPQRGDGPGADGGGRRGAGGAHRRAGSPRSSWRRSRCRAGTTSPASSPASPATTATSSTTWSRRSCSVSPNDVRSFLLQTSILDRLSGPLCDAVTGQDGGKAHAGGAGARQPVPGPARRPPPVVPLPPPLRRRAARAPAGRAARPTSPSCTGGRATGTSRTASRPRRSATRWPPRTSSARRTWSSWRCPAHAQGPAGGDAASAGSRRCPTRCSASGPCSATRMPGRCWSSGEVEGVEARLRDAERWLDATGRGATGALRPGWSSWTRRSSAVSRRRSPCTAPGWPWSLGDVAGTVTHARRALDLVAEDDHLGRGAAAALLGLASWTSGDLEAAHRSYADGHGEPASGPGTSPTCSAAPSPWPTSASRRAVSARRCAPTSGRCSSRPSRAGRCCGERRTCTWA